MSWQKKVDLAQRDLVSHWITVHAEDNGDVWLGVGTGSAETVVPMSVNQAGDLAHAIQEAIRKVNP